MKDLAMFFSIRFHSLVKDRRETVLTGTLENLAHLEKKLSLIQNSGNVSKGPSGMHIYSNGL